MLFEPLETTKKFGDGSGLDLAISQKIMEAHDGWILAVNNAGGGATFVVMLPARS